MAVGKPTTPKVTGGGGFAFEDKVAAWFLAHMLAGWHPFHPAYGLIQKVHFQVRESGWFLDDLLLLLSDGSRTRQCALSVKSNTQVTTKGFPAEFVKAVWQQQQLGSGNPFTIGVDSLGLVTAYLTGDLQAAWDQISAEARGGDPKRVAARFGDDRASELKQSIFKSVECPAELCGGTPISATSKVALLRSILLLHLDFESQPSIRESEAIEVCRAALRDATVDNAIGLWDRLIQLAASQRPVGGFFDLASLVAKLQPDFSLKDHPDYESDWKRLETLSQEALSDVRGEIGNGLKLDRTALIQSIAGNLSQCQILLLHGDSGTGKSAALARGVSSGALPGRTLWLDRRHLDHAGASAVASSLGLQNNLSDLILVGTMIRSILVLDGIEQFSDDALIRASELVRHAIDRPDLWKVIVTCRPEGTETVLRELVKRGVDPRAAKPIPVKAPEFTDLLALVRDVPGISQLLLRTELRPFLCNLKVLDWVVTAQLTSPSTGGFVREFDVVDWIWDRWLGSGPDRHQRAALLMKLGEREGSSLQPGFSRPDLTTEELAVVHALENERLVRVRQGSVALSHDLAGDWARCMSLVEAGDGGISLARENAQHPRWQYAIRLHVRRILETGGVEKWLEFTSMRASDSADDILLVDYCLDALYIGSNSGVLLERAWPYLVANKAELLERLLARFMHVGTIPDPRVEGYLSAEHMDWARAHVRTPNVLYWHSLLGVLDRHIDDVVKHATLGGARVCGLWLRTMPHEWGGRPEAARVAIRLAREVQAHRAEGVVFLDDCDEPVYESALYAVRDLPEEVCAFALEMSQRRPEANEIAARRSARRKREQEDFAERMKDPEYAERIRRMQSLPHSIDFDEFRPLRPPAPDGPSDRVADSFQKAVLNTQALLPMIETRPAVAREVLLAVCIEEPTRIRRDDLVILDQLGMAHWPDAHPSMYFRGPFLQFLRLQPEEGLNAIIRLVNHATERWAEAGARVLGAQPQDAPTITFQLPTGPVQWVGNGTVFGWYREVLISSSVVTSALMALEKWLYEMEEKNDSLLDRWIERILLESRSVGMLGVLTAVGLKQPALLSGPLRPILGIPEIYQMQQALALDRSWEIGLSLGWVRQGEELFKAAQEWHTLPHRQHVLRDQAVRLLLSNQAVRDFFAECRKTWTARLKETPQKGDLDLLIARFDPANYRLRRVDENHAEIFLEWPASLRKRIDRQLESLASDQRLLLFPSRCRRILSGEETLANSEAEVFWSDLRATGDSIPIDDEHAQNERTNAIAGGLAVLFVTQRSWLSGKPERDAWCLEQLRTLKLGAPLFPSVGLNEHDAEGFLAEAAISIFAEDAPDWVRARVGAGVMGHYYTSTGITMNAAFRHRSKLGADFERLLNLVILWAGLRFVGCGIFGTDVERGYLATRQQRLLRAFVQRRIPAKRITLAAIAAAAQTRIERLESSLPDSFHARMRRAARDGPPQQRRGPTSVGFDSQVLQHGLSWLPQLSEISDPSDRRQWIEIHRELLGLMLGSFPEIEESDREINGTPTHFGHWVLRRIAMVVVQTSPDEQPESFWKPILDLGRAGHYWVQRFALQFLGGGPQLAPTRERFSEIWASIVRYALETPHLRTREGRYSFYSEEITCSLLGLGITGEHLRKAEFAPVMETMAPLFDRWAKEWLVSNRAAGHFAYFLTGESASALLPMGIRRLWEAASRYTAAHWDEKDLAATFGDALKACWTAHKQKLRQDSDLRSAFLGLLNLVAGHLDPGALELRQHVAKGLGDLR